MALQGWDFPNNNFEEIELEMIKQAIKKGVDVNDKDNI